MRVLELSDGTQVYHDLGESLVPLTSLLLRDRAAVAALGPVYVEDPAAGLLAPFRRTADATGWVAVKSLAPEWVWERARELRREAAAGCTDLLFDGSVRDLVDWTRAGVVLGYAQHRGVRVKGRGLLHVRWRLRGTVTGRFGAETVRGPDWTFNPLSLGPDDRWAVVPRADGRRIAVLDFKAMDLCSMRSLVPGMSSQPWNQHDPYRVVAQVVSEMADPPPEFRNVVKVQVFVHAYGGESVIRRELERTLPELDWLRRLPQGEAGRRVQSQSALAFRAALSRAMPMLTGEDVVPIFTVHDELALDYSEGALDRVRAAAVAMEEGASTRIGVPYRVDVSTGASYEEAKHR